SRCTLIRLGMGATSGIRANECRAAPSAKARETGRASASAMGLLTPPLCAGPTLSAGSTTDKKRAERVNQGCAAERRGGGEAISNNLRTPSISLGDNVGPQSTQAPTAMNPSVHAGRPEVLQFARGEDALSRPLYREELSASTHV